MATFPPPSTDDVDQLNKSFWFEAGTLASQGMLYLRRGAELAGDSELYAAADALFESLLTKLRSLDSFFLNLDNAATDAVASDLAAGWSPRAILTKDERRKINVRVAHLTYLRPHEHEWEIGRILHRAFETIADFMDQASVGGRYGWEYRRKEVGDILAGWGDLDDVMTNNDAHAHR